VEFFSTLFKVLYFFELTLDAVKKFVFILFHLYLFSFKFSLLLSQFVNNTFSKLKSRCDIILYLVLLSKCIADFLLLPFTSLNSALKIGYDDIHSHGVVFFVPSFGSTPVSAMFFTSVGAKSSVI
jgi:hypothetical protein